MSWKTFRLNFGWHKIWRSRCRTYNAFVTSVLFIHPLSFVLQFALAPHVWLKSCLRLVSAQDWASWPSFTLRLRERLGHWWRNKLRNHSARPGVGRAWYHYIRRHLKTYTNIASLFFSSVLHWLPWRIVYVKCILHENRCSPEKIIIKSSSSNKWTHLTSKSRLDELNFIHRMLYKDTQWMWNFMRYLFPLFVTCAEKLRHVSF